VELLLWYLLESTYNILTIKVTADIKHINGFLVFMAYKEASIYP